MSLRIAPAAGHPTTRANTTAQNTSAPSAPGLHDTLRHAHTPSPEEAVSTTGTVTQAPQSTHPLDARLARWTATQEALKMEGLRRTFGMAEPIRRGMELRLVSEGDAGRAVALGKASGVSADILRGRDWEFGWEDVFVGDETREIGDFHVEMERRLKMDW